MFRSHGKIPISQYRYCTYFTLYLYHWVFVICSFVATSASNAARLSESFYSISAYPCLLSDANRMPLTHQINRRTDGRTDTLIDKYKVRQY